MELNQILIAISKKLGKTIASHTEIAEGMNNKLFKLEDENGERYLLKIYQEGQEDRMQREVDGVAFLNEHKFTNVPKLYTYDKKNYYALYSFVNGVSKEPSEVTKSDLEQMADFMGQVHTIDISQMYDKYLNANFACFSLQNYIDNITFRLKKFEEYTTSNDVPESVKQLANLNINSKINSLIESALKGVEEEDVKKVLGVHEQRLSPVDFGVHNILFDNGRLTFLDFEYFGKDDPARAVADFIKHDRSQGISEELKDYFLKRYLKVIEANDIYKKHLEIVMQLVDIEWLAIYLYSMTPEKVRIRKFSDKNFNEELYLQKQIEKLNNRLSQLSN